MCVLKTGGYLSSFPIKAHPRSAARVRWDAELKLSVVGENDGTERQRVGADWREEDGADIRVHHGAACIGRTGTVRLNVCVCVCVCMCVCEGENNYTMSQMCRMAMFTYAEW
jgi:hypothetical protein